MMTTRLATAAAFCVLALVVPGSTRATPPPRRPTRPAG